MNLIGMEFNILPFKKKGSILYLIWLVLSSFVLYSIEIIRTFENISFVSLRIRSINILYLM